MRTVVSGLAAATLCIAVEPLLAAEPTYLDDRSGPAAVVRSLYNAISRHEYARAWDYFGSTKPAKDFDAFVRGYAGTEKVDVETGAVSEEGAAGSIFFKLPVAIRATATDGSEKVFAGCYTLRQLSPAAQEPPFKPILIDKGSLKASSDDLQAAVPASCGDGPPPAKADTVLEQARQAFAASYGGQCTPDLDDPSQAEPQAHTLKYHETYEGADQQERESRLFRFFCSMAAYNEDAVYYLYDEIQGLRQLQFAAPELDIHYENNNSEGKVEALNITGFQTDDRLVNSDYDETTKTIRSYAKWRGVGDASESGAWLFRNGDFALVRYEVDASYDGEINPETVLDYETPP